MALVLDATPGSATANTYCTIEEAEAYFETRLHDAQWEEADDEDKAPALVWATALLDNIMLWDGYKADDSQALRWPRTFVYDPDGHLLDETTIPAFLRDATAEFARFLVIEDRTAESGNLGIKEIKLGTLGLKFDKYDRRGIIPISVMNMIRHYGSTFAQRPRLLERV